MAHMHELFKYGEPDVAVDGPHQRYRCRVCGGNTFTLKKDDRVIVHNTLLFNNRVGTITEVGPIPTSAPNESYWDFHVELDKPGPDDPSRTSIGVDSFQISPLETDNGEN